MTPRIATDCMHPPDSLAYLVQAVEQDVADGSPTDGILEPATEKTGDASTAVDSPQAIAGNE